MSFRHFAAAEPKLGRPTLRMNTPVKDIFTACREGDVETVRKRLDEGVDVNEGKQFIEKMPWEVSVNRNGVTYRKRRRGREFVIRPLELACRNGRIEVVRLLLDAGADVNADVEKEGDRVTYLERRMLTHLEENRRNNMLVVLALGAIEEEHTLTNVYADILRLFLSRPEINVNKDAPLVNLLGREKKFTACYQIATLFLAHPRFDVNQADDYGWTLLHGAVPDKVFLRRLLADERLNPNLASKRGHMTPLMYALNDEKRVRRWRIKDLLNDARVDPNIPDESGQTPLMYAVRKRKHAVKYLLANVRVNLNQTMTVTAYDMANFNISQRISPQSSYLSYFKVSSYAMQIKREIDKRRKKQKRELARVMHRKQIEEGKGHKREAPTDVLKHIGSFLDHEMKSKLHF